VPRHSDKPTIRSTKYLTGIDLALQLPCPSHFWLSDELHTQSCQRTSPSSYRIDFINQLHNYHSSCVNLPRSFICRVPNTFIQLIVNLLS